MDRRFLLWLVLCFLLMVVWQTWIMPPPKRPDGKPGQQAQQVRQPLANDEANEGNAPPIEKKDPAENDQQPAADPAERTTAEDLPDQATTPDGAPSNDQRTGEERAAGETLPPQPLKFVALGSLDPQAPYRLLATITSEGAAVRRLELANPRYRELDDRSGYVGHLELLQDDQEGLLVRVVGAGTPAAKAGLQAGDRILGFVGEKENRIKTLDAWRQRLARTKPGRTITLQVARTVEGRNVQLELPTTLARRPLETLRPESENVRVRDERLPEGWKDTPSFLTTLQGVDATSLDGEVGAEGAPKRSELAGVSLLQENWELVEHSGEMAQFRRRVPRWGLEFTKTYRVTKAPLERLEDPDFPAYDLTLELTVRNVGESPRQAAYRLDGPNGLPVEGWWYAQKVGRSSNVGLRDVVGRYFGADPQQVGATDVSNGKAAEFQGGSMAWAGVDAQYFSVVMLPEKASADEAWLDRVVPVEVANRSPTLELAAQPVNPQLTGRFANVTCRLISQPATLQPGGELRHAYRIFSGPKRPSLLANYQAVGDPNYSLSDLAYYGWPMFSNVAKVMLAILHFFYDIVGNYGLAIILLTVLVRGCMFPLSRGQAKSMAKMQELRPELDRIKEKYKGDPQKAALAQQELWRKNGVNPMAGCLPVLIQLPIFIGLYRCLAVDVELRQAPLLGNGIRWCSNLAAPDMLFDWSRFMPDMIVRGEGFFGLGPYLNVLPLVTIALFLLQQKMFMPPPANEQAEMQQKLMKYMMIFMGLMFYKVPSGLCIYFIASSLWGIAERKFVPHPTPPSATAAAVPAPENRSEPRRQQQRPKSKRRR